MKQLQKTQITYPVLEDSWISGSKANISVSGKHIKGRNGRAISWDVIAYDNGRKIKFSPGVACFDEGSTECAFAFDDIFKKHGVSITRVCTVGHAGTSSVIYKIESTGRTAYLYYNSDEGSIGSSNFLELWLSHDMAFAASIGCK